MGKTLLATATFCVVVINTKTKNSVISSYEMEFFFFKKKQETKPSELGFLKIRPGLCCQLKKEREKSIFAQRHLAVV